MQIAKFSLWVCAFAVCGVVALHAADTPAQATARAELLKHLQGPATNAPAAKPKPIPAPAKPMSKEQKLQDLLAKYKANQITPQQYHEQRAAILAQP